MKTIWKFPIAITDFQSIPVPLGAMPIFANLDPLGTPCVWCEVESDNTDREPIHIFVIGTGNPMPSRARTYLGSFIQGPFVWHIYTP